MEGYCEWAKNDTRVELIDARHIWASQAGPDTRPDKPNRYRRGANEFPLLHAKMREDGREGNHGVAAPLK